MPSSDIVKTRALDSNQRGFRLENYVPGGGRCLDPRDAFLSGLSNNDLMDGGREEWY